MGMAVAWHIVLALVPRSIRLLSWDVIIKVFVGIRYSPGLVIKPPPSVVMVTVIFARHFMVIVVLTVATNRVG